MKDYRVFLNDGSHEDVREVTAIELVDRDGKKEIVFLFENHGIDYTYPLSIVFAFSVLE